MKMVVAVIAPSRLDQVRESLSALEIRGMTVTEVRGFGRQQGQKEIYRGAEYEIHFVPKLKIEIAVADARVEEATEAIRQAANTGKIGAGKIFVIDLRDAMRIRTSERGDDAL